MDDLLNIYPVILPDAGLDYEAFGGDAEKLKAADYHNLYEDSLRVFDVCMAKHSCGAKCGIYMPATYWLRPSSKWKFYCKISWAQVIKHHPHVAEQFIARGCGENPDLWPGASLCCGAKFAPWKRGPSKVVEMLVEGKWVCFLAERLPEQLDDEIKKVQEAWHRAQGQVTAEEIMAGVPLMYPVTNVINGTEYPGVSKFDFAQWEKDGQPVLSHAGWCALCKVIADKDPLNLQLIFDVASDIQERISSKL